MGFAGMTLCSERGRCSNSEGAHLGSVLRHPLLAGSKGVSPKDAMFWGFRLVPWASAPCGENQQEGSNWSTHRRGPRPMGFASSLTWEFAIGFLLALIESNHRGSVNTCHTSMSLFR